MVAMGAHPGRDLVAGITVGLVALPLALGFGISSGLGAGAGLLTAIIAGVVAAVFGGSDVQVSGPTGAMTVVLVPIVARHGGQGVLVVGLLAGAILVVLAYTGAGRFIRFLPLPVVEGFTLGIAIIIGLQQLPSALGVHVRADKVLVLAGRAVRAGGHHLHWAALGIALVVALIVVGAGRHRPRVPIALLAVVGATVVDRVFGLHAEPIGAIPHGLPAPALPHVKASSLAALVLPAFAVAALAALESLLSATVSDAMTISHRHDPDRELLGQGLANMVSPLFGGIPATAAIARTAVNVRAGAHSRTAAVTHSLVLLVVVLAASSQVASVPRAALAGVLLATAARMVELSGLLAVLRSTRGDAIALAVTAIATVAVDLVTAVIVGLVIAGAFALHATAQTARLDEMPLDGADHHDEEQHLLDERIVAYRLDGPLFFAAAHTFLLELSELADARVVIIRMSHVTTLDATGAHLLADTISTLERRGITVLLSGVQAQHEQVLHSIGVYDHLAHERHLFAHTPEAIAHARAHAARAHPTHAMPHHTRAPDTPPTP